MLSDLERDYYSSLYNRGPSAMEVLFYVCLVLAIAGAVILLITFLNKKNERKFTGFAGWLYNFLNFREMILETILRGLYLALAGFMTLYAIVGVFFTGLVGECLLAITLGNLALRIGFELLTLVITIARNLNEINKKMVDPKAGVVEEPLVVDTTHCSRCGAPKGPNMAFCPQCGASMDNL